MAYKSLKKIYYKKMEDVDAVYQARCQSEAAYHFDIWIKQYKHKTSYPAFLCLTQEMFLLMERIYKSYEVFLYLVNTVPHVILRQFSLLCIVDEVKSTNDIEGVRSTRREIKEILDGGIRKSHRLESIVQKYRGLLSKEKIAFETSHDIRKFYDEFAHEEVIRDDPRNELDGEIFRKDSVDIASPTERTVHQGIFPEARIIEEMEKALAVLHDEKIPVLIRTAVFHYFFAYIHPFYDGNGRTVRFITAYFLGKHLHPLATVRLSVIFKKHQKRYYKLFEETDSELNRAEMTLFVEEFIRFIAESIDDTVRILERKKEQVERYRQQIEEMNLEDALTKDLYYILLQAALFYGQGITIQELEKVLERSRATIQKRLDKIPQKDLVKTRKRAIYYKINMLLFKKEKAEGGKANRA